MAPTTGAAPLLDPAYSAAKSETEDSGSSPARKCVPKPVRFFEPEKWRLRPEPRRYWVLRIQPRNLRQRIPDPAQQESAYQNLSAFLNRKNGAYDRSRAAIGSCVFSREI